MNRLTGAALRSMRNAGNAVGKRHSADEGMRAEIDHPESDSTSRFFHRLDLGHALRIYIAARTTPIFPLENPLRPGSRFIHCGNREMMKETAGNFVDCMQSKNGQKHESINKTGEFHEPATGHFIAIHLMFPVRMTDQARVQQPEEWYRYHR